MHSRSNASHHRIIVKFHSAHIIDRVQNDFENPVIIFCVYPVLSTVTTQAVLMLIWMCPETPNMELPRQFEDDHRTVARCMVHVRFLVSLSKSNVLIASSCFVERMRCFLQRYRGKIYRDALKPRCTISCIKKILSKKDEACKCRPVGFLACW